MPTSEYTHTFILQNACHAIEIICTVAQEELRVVCFRTHVVQRAHAVEQAEAAGCLVICPIQFWPSSEDRLPRDATWTRHASVCETEVEAREQQLQASGPCVTIVT